MGGIALASPWTRPDVGTLAMVRPQSKCSVATPYPNKWNHVNLWICLPQARLEKRESLIGFALRFPRSHFTASLAASSSELEDMIP